MALQPYDFIGKSEGITVKRDTLFIPTRSKGVPPFTEWRPYKLEKYWMRKQPYKYLSWYCNGTAPPYAVEKTGTFPEIYGQYSSSFYNSSVRQAAYDAALSKLVQILSQNRNQWNAAVTLAESAKTAQTFINAANRIARSWVALKKGNVRQMLNELGYQGYTDRAPPTHVRWGTSPRTAASYWMEYKNAWMPILSDVDSAAKYFARKHIEKSFAPLRMYGKGKAESSLPSVIYTGMNPTPATFLEKSGMRRWTASCKLTVEAYPRFFYEPTTLDELGFTDPATVLWEISPFSWLVDWFVNVGEVLSSLHELQHWTIVSGLHNARESSYYWLKSQPGTYGLALCSATYGYFRPTYTIGSGWGAEMHSRVSRAVGWRPPTSVRLRMNLEDPFRGTRAVTAIALLITGSKAFR